MPPRVSTIRASSLLDTEKDLRDASAPKTRNQVAVACKLPNGLILRLFHWEEVSESTPTGAMKVRVAREDPGSQVKLNGCATAFGQVPEYTINLGYAITMVDEEYWNKWLSQNSDSDLIRSKVIFAARRLDLVTDQIKDQHAAGIRSGLEPINPKKPPVVGVRPVDNKS